MPSTSISERSLALIALRSQWLSQVANWQVSLSIGAICRTAIEHITVCLLIHSWNSAASVALGLKFRCTANGYVPTITKAKA
jgi:hypothetical protein